MEKLLIIEDNKDVNDMLCETLSAEGYQVKSVYDGLAGMRELKSEAYDIVLLDLMLPYRSGDGILKELRKFSNIPVVILSAKDMVETKIDVLKLGADDYITKPFDLGEVAARVAVCLRRTKTQQIVESIYTYKDIELSAIEKRLTVAKIEVDLTSKEYMIMELLLKNKGKLFSKANIYETIWKEEYLGDDNAIKTHMSNLRFKLKKANPEEEYIETVWGLGYRLCKSDS
jgi:DNA-binding response OmpR family regulator